MPSHYCILFRKQKSFSFIIICDGSKKTLRQWHFVTKQHDKSTFIFRDKCDNCNTFCVVRISISYFLRKHMIVSSFEFQKIPGKELLFRVLSFWKNREKHVFFWIRSGRFFNNIFFRLTTFSEVGRLPDPLFSLYLASLQRRFVAFTVPVEKPIRKLCPANYVFDGNHPFRHSRDVANFR